MANHLQQELRHIKASKLTLLSNIIDQSKSYTDLLNFMSTGQFPSLCITLESAHLIKRQPSPTLALLNHWAITGRRRPTVLDLIELLRTCDLKRAEAFVWREILNQEPPTQTTAYSGKLENDRPRESLIDIEFTFEDLTSVVSSISDGCLRYSFDSIYKSTNKFCHKPLDYSADSGFKIGDGRFSSVFLAQAVPEKTNEVEQQMIQLVAAKLLKSECNVNYLVNEINLAKKIRHENILELLGVSIGYEDENLPRYICLIYPYMQNGSLFECLNHGARCNKGEKIPWQKRLDIAKKVAQGIEYLHTFHEGVIIHRDIKTANILIDENLSPKLGDFTLVRQLDSLKQGETEYSQNVIGTSVYMPPEAFRGDISTKFDVFSFGIVLLELLTGLKPFNDSAGEDLLTYISEKLSDLEEEFAGMSVSDNSELRPSYKFLKSALDSSAGDWSIDKASVIFDQALRATEVRKKARPDISEILTIIKNTVD